MVQLISLEISKPIVKNKTQLSIDKNEIDFLELLLKNSQKTKTAPEYDFENDNKIEKTEVEIDKKNDDLEIEFISTPQLKIEQIKKIIISNIKEQNITLSKNEVREFKKINNIQELVKFANKKGLNVKKIKFEIEEEIKKENKKSLFTNQFLNMQKKTKKDKITKEELKPLSTKNNSKNEKSEKPQTNLETLLTKKDKKTDNNINKDTILQERPKNKTNEKPQTNLETLLTKKEKRIDSNTNKNTILKETPKNKTSEKPHTNLETLLTKKRKSEKNDENSSIEKNELKGGEKVGNSHSTIPQQIKGKIVEAKRKIENFTQNLDDTIKRYKLPISKIEIEIAPEKLGKVEVTIIKRGDKLNIKMSSDNNNINLFQTHQAEFKSALYNIGFSNIDMSFNSNQDRDRKQQQNSRKNHKDNEQIEDNEKIEIEANYKYA